MRKMCVDGPLVGKMIDCHADMPAVLIPVSRPRKMCFGSQVDVDPPRNPFAIICYDSKGTYLTYNEARSENVQV